MKTASLILAAFVVATIFDAFRYDDTDPGGIERSGLRLLTDARTGCQYLSAGFGGITPRLDGERRHVGCRS